MTWDQFVLLVVWVVFIALTLSLLIKVDWKDWGLVGLLVLASAVTSLVTLLNLNQWITGEAVDVPGYLTMVWSWRYGAVVGGIVVLIGLLLEFHRKPPPREQVVRRLSLGVAVIGAIAIGFWWAA